MRLSDQQAIMICEPDGREVPFDPAELQQRVEQCFIEAGLSEQRFLAGDFIRSVEYILSTRRDAAPVGRNDLNSAIIGALEESGFPAVAAIYRMTGGVREVRVSAELPVIQNLLARFVAGTPVQNGKLAVLVQNALNQLKIRQAPPKLVVELARHFWWDEMQGLPLGPPPPPPQRIAAPELVSYCPTGMQEWLDGGILTLHGITPILPALRMEVKFRALAQRLGLTPPVLDLEMAPELYRLSGVLAECRRTILQRLGKTPEELPFFLDLPDMSDFVTREMAGERIHYRKIGRELVRTLISALPENDALQIKML